MSRPPQRDRCADNGPAPRAGRPHRHRFVAAIGAAAIAIGVVATPASRAQTGAPIDTTPTRSTLDEAAGDGCGSVSVVVRRCAAPAPAPADPKADELTRSREKTKAGFDRNARRGTRDALNRAPTDPASGTAPDGAATVAPVGPAQRLAPVTVTGHDDDPAPAPETVLQRALNPNQVVLPNGNIVTYMPGGDRSECLAQCVGPACCTVVRARPNPARLSNSIGQ